MKQILSEINISSQRKYELIDITDRIQEIVKKSSVKEGMCFLFVPHATAGFLINENEEGLKKDIIRFFNDIVSLDKYYHNQIDNNAQSHILASVLKPNLCLIIEKSSLILGPWQQIFLVELDGPRKARRIKIKIMGN